MEGGGGLGFGDRRHLYSPLICDGAGKVGRHRSKAQRGFGRTVAEVQESKMQRYKISPSLLRCMASVGRHGDTEINNAIVIQKDGLSRKRDQ